MYIYIVDLTFLRIVLFIDFFLPKKVSFTLVHLLILTLFRTNGQQYRRESERERESMEEKGIGDNEDTQPNKDQSGTVGYFQIYLCLETHRKSMVSHAFI